MGNFSKQGAYLCLKTQSDIVGWQLLFTNQWEGSINFYGQYRRCSFYHWIKKGPYIESTFINQLNGHAFVSLFIYDDKPNITKKSLHYNLTILFYQFKKPTIPMPSRQLSTEAKHYDSQQFKILYIYIKSLNLINQLYLSEVMDIKQFEQQQKDILNRYQKIKLQIKNKNENVDFERFAELYNIQAEYKRIQSQPQTEEDKKIIQLAILLTSKITEIYDTLHQSKLVKDLINIVTEIDMLLTKLKLTAKRISPEFAKWMNKISEIKQNIKKKSIHEELTSMQMYELEDSITKIKILFEEFSAQ